MMNKKSSQEKSVSKKKIVLKKDSIKKKSVQKITASTKKIKPAKTKNLPASVEVVEGKFLGKVQDYFAHIGVMAVTLKDMLAVGDTIRVKGHTTDLVVKVESIQMEHQPVTMAKKGQGVGIKIHDRARFGDRVYRI